MRGYTINRGDDEERDAKLTEAVHAISRLVRS